jgi:hypothetical protein
MLYWEVHPDRLECVYHGSCRSVFPCIVQDLLLAEEFGELNILPRLNQDQPARPG